MTRILEGPTVGEFTEIAAEYDKGRSGEDVGFWVKEAERLAGLDEECVILDLGCGTGLYIQGLEAQTSVKACGLDPSVGILGQAREKISSVHWLNGVGERLPLRSGVLDCIFSSQV